MSVPGVPPLLVDAFGARWWLDTDGLGSPVAERVRALWARAEVPERAGGDTDVLPFTLGREDEAVLIAGARYRIGDDALPYAVSRALTVASLERRMGDCLLLHAAGLARPDGTTLALVAASGTGKTTSARVLGRSFGYVSDETVAIEDDLSVRAHPKPLSIVVDPASPHDKEERSPDELGLLVAPDALRLGGVVVLDRDPAAGEPSLTPLSLVEAAVAVVPQTSALLRMPDPMGALARALTAGGGPWRLTYAEIDRCRDLLVHALDAVRDEPATWEVEAGDGGVDERPEACAPPALDPSTVLGRAPFRHALHAEGSTLVLVGTVPMALPGMASTLWRAAQAPRRLADLTEAAVAGHGRHPRAAEVVAETAAGLVASGAFVVLA
ncbi:hypothetical protein ATL31_1791 [Phycicoccus duodecadis]|uniref:Hpr(Ser) kinase/phosphatase n=2 Tax=Phycicoccus duodecadis TaxID=173053 RepID=A0A2N3YJC3_9MICO|nr:hypothetical protein ATL31_1791 [Phycicoccus duodecadis]